MCIFLFWWEKLPKPTDLQCSLPNPHPTPWPHLQISAGNERLDCCNVQDGVCWGLRGGVERGVRPCLEGGVFHRLQHQMCSCLRSCLQRGATVICCCCCCRRRFCHCCCFSRCLWLSAHWRTAEYVRMCPGESKARKPNSKLTSFTLYNSQGRMLSGGRGSLWNGVSARLQEGSSTIS